MTIPDLEATARLTPLQMVQEFHATFRCVTGAQWSVKLGTLRANLIVEECDELGWALLAGDPLAIAQELADLAYVTIGAAVALGLSLSTTGTAERASYGYAWAQCSRLAGTLRVGDLAVIGELLPEVLRSLYGVAIAEGIDLDVAIGEVHAANMRKLGPDGEPIFRSDGKILKPTGWYGPDMSAALRPASATEGDAGSISERSRSRARGQMTSTTSGE